MARKKATVSPSIMRRFLPALVFVLGVAVLVLAVCDTGYSALPPSEKRYTAAKAAADSLKADPRRSGHRDQWLRLAEEFYDIYNRDLQWVNRPAALFRSAEMLEELGSRSFAPRDYRLAVERYERLAEKHATSRLADDALLRAAGIRARNLNDRGGALRLLRQIRTQYGRADMAGAAASLEKELTTAEKPQAPEKTQAGEKAQPAQTAVEKAPAKPVPAARAASGKRAAQGSPAGKDAAQTAARSGEKNKTPCAELTRITWATLSKDKVEITVELDRHAPWQVRMRDAAKGRNTPARLILEMDGTVPVEQIKSGARVKGSLLTRVAVNQNKQNGTALAFDFTSAKRYDARVEQNPFRIVLTVLAGNSAAPRKGDARVGFAENSSGLGRGSLPETVSKPAVAQSGKAAPSAARNARAAVAGNMAAQLGLTVQTVFIDAGHGGKDPGTMHNKLVERDVVLDISRRVGRLLAANGLEVEYSRTGDSFVPLSARPRKANSVRADLFVSIHINASSDASIQGFETFYLDLARNTEAARVATLENAKSDRKLGDMQSVLAEVMLNARTQESSRLAEDIQRMAVSRIGRRGFQVKNGGTRSAPFHVLIGAGMPAVLVEVGYCTHAGEAKLLASPQYRHAVAEGIAEGIMAYRNRLQHRHSAQFTLTTPADGAI